jgi:hypothetical protein
MKLFSKEFKSGFLHGFSPFHFLFGKREPLKLPKPINISDSYRKVDEALAKSMCIVGKEIHKSTKKTD